MTLRMLCAYTTMIWHHVYVWLSSRITPPSRAIDPGAIGSELPLSWVRRQVIRPNMSVVPLPFSGLKWVTQCDIPQEYSFARVYADMLATLPRGFLVRGCSSQVARFFIAHGCSALRVGIEATIDLDSTSLSRPAVKTMAKRARRHGNVREVAWSEQAASELARLVRETRHSNRPQLHHLFRSSFQPGMRLWVFVTPDGRWQGALLILMASTTHAVTERMLRRASAPGGVIEELITVAGTQLHADGARTLSLNEVPFHYLTAELTLMEQLVRAASYSLHGVYNSEGLFHFKAKFDPIWSPVYLCAYPRISLLSLCDLFIQSGCFNLAVRRAK